MLGKAVIGADFDEKPLEEVISKSNRARRKERKVVLFTHIVSMIFSGNPRFNQGQQVV